MPMNSEQKYLAVVGNYAFANESFTKLIAELAEKFEISYLPDLSTCISRLGHESGHHGKDPLVDCTWFLLSDFTCASDLQTLSSLVPKARIMGYPAFVHCILKQEKWLKPRPVFNFSMLGAVVCITGYRDRQLVNHLATLVHWMGGSVQRNLNVNTTTHLVAYRCAGDKVRSAALTARRIATVKASWVEEAWESRTKEPVLKATDSEFVSKHRAKVFQETCLAFVGFAPNSDEMTEMSKLVTAHDGLVTDDLHDERLTHVVVTDAWPGHGNILEQLKQLVVSESNLPSAQSHASSLTSETNGWGDHHNLTSTLAALYRVPVVRLEWFWLSVQLTCLCKPEHYQYVAGPCRTNTSKCRPVSLPPLAGTSSTLSPPPPSHHLSDLTNTIKEEAEESESGELATQDTTGSTIPPLTPLERIKELETRSLDSPKMLEDKLSPRVGFIPLTGGSLKGSPVAKVSFISPSHRRKTPRGFLSPPKDGNIRNQSSNLSASSSHENLLSQLADPLSLPSNRQRQLSQLAQTGESSQEPFWSPPPNSSSFNSGMLLNTINTSDHPAEQKSFGLLSLVGSLREVLGSEEETPSSTAEVTQEQTGSTTTFSAPDLPTTVVDTTSQAQTSTPVSGKRKSTSRMSLLHPTTRKSRTSADPVVATTPASTESGGAGTPLQKQLEKRRFRVFEFFVTERNYVDILRYLYRVAYPEVLDEDQSGGAILPKQEADYIFGKLGPIFELHERLQSKLDHLESNWSDTESCLSDVLQMDLLEEMDKAYGNYMQFYSPPHMHHLGEQFPRFLAFMRQVERRKDSGRQSLTALLVRPVQRLPSVSLLLDGIVKFTPNTHPDYEAISEFARGLNGMLAKINDRLRKNEEHLSMLSLYHDIVGAPPEMLSSSRSLITHLDVYELGTSSSGNTTCEPVTLYLLTDLLEVVKPRKRRTGEPLAHAIKAALTAVQGENFETNDPTRDPGIAPCGESNQLTTSTADPSGGASSGVNVSRSGSGASTMSIMNLGLLEGKQHCRYKHVHLLKLHEIKRVVNFDTASSDRAAFGLIVRSNSELNERVYAYCLALSFAAVAASRDPAAVTTESTNSFTGGSLPATALQTRVSEVKRAFLQRLCHQIVQVSCLANSPDELLADVQPEELLGLDLEQVFNAAATALKSKKFSRQLTRNISIKTPRRPVASSKARTLTASTPQQPGHPAQHDDIISHSVPSSPRRSVIGSFLGQRGPNMESAVTPETMGTPLQSRRHLATAFDVPRPPATPTADQMSSAMVNLFGPTQRAPSSSYPVDTDDYFYEDYPDADCLSIASTNFAAGGSMFWHPKPSGRALEATASSVSLRSNQLMDGGLTSHAPNARNSMSRRGPFDRSSVMLSSHDSQRKSFSHAVLAGWKSLRRSIAGAGSSFLHHSNAAPSPLNCHHTPARAAVGSSVLASPAVLNRSASVDLNIRTSTRLTAASPLTSTTDLRQSGLSLNRPAPLRETELEGDMTSPTVAASQPAAHPAPMPKQKSSALNGLGMPRQFPRSMTIQTPGSISLRNRSQGISPLLSRGKPTVTADDVGMDAIDTSPYDRLNGSIMSLTSLDSVSIADLSQEMMEDDVREHFPHRQVSNAENIAWETASHLGIRTDDPHTFRCPSGAPSGKMRRRERRHKLGVLANLFGGKGSNVTGILKPINTNRPEHNGQSVAKPNASRRESLLRGLFSR